MKTYNKYIALAAMALTFAACTQEDDFTPQTDGDAVKINATIGRLQTRVAYEDNGATNFINGDEICVQNTLRETKNIATYTFDGTTWTTTDALVWNGGTAESQFQAWYPATASFDEFTLPTDQNSIEELPAADWMTASTSAMVKPDDKTINLAFEHKLAKVTVQITEFTSQFGDDPRLMAATIYSLSDEYVTVNGGIKPVLGGNAATAIVCPGKYTPETNLMEVTISDDGRQTFLNVPVNAFLTDTGLEAGKHYTFSLKVGKEAVTIADVNVTPWTEQTIDGVDTEECLHATWSGNKCTDCGATIEITGMKYVGDEAVYDAETNTYTILISPSAGNVAPHVQFIGKNLEYYSKNHPCAEMLMIYQSDTEFGEYECYLYDLVYRDGKYIADPYSSIDGHFSEYQYSNDGGQTWSEEKLRTEIRYGYNVVVNESQNGTVTADMTFVAAGWIVNLNVAPAEGYMLDMLTVTDGNGNSVNVENNAFTMPASAVTVNATFKSLNN